MTAATIERPSLAVAAEFRAALGRLGLNQSDLARRTGRNTVWISKRIGTRATIDMTMEEISEMADALGVEAEGIVLAALRACRDSNPKPSDREFWAIVSGVNGQLAAECCNGSGWALAS